MDAAPALRQVNITDSINSADTPQRPKRRWLPAESYPLLVRKRKNGAPAAKGGFASQAGIKTIDRQAYAKRQSHNRPAEVPIRGMEVSGNPCSMASVISKANKATRPMREPTRTRVS